MHVVRQAIRHLVFIAIGVALANVPVPLPGTGWLVGVPFPVFVVERSHGNHLYFTSCFSLLFAIVDVLVGYAVARWLWYKTQRVVAERSRNPKGARNRDGDQI